MNAGIKLSEKIKEVNRFGSKRIISDYDYLIKLMKLIKLSKV